jgi:hypothetical protein
VVSPRTKRALASLATALASDTVGRVVLWLTTLVLTGAAVFAASLRSVLAGAAGGLAVTGITSILRRQLEYRNEPYSIIERRTRVFVADHGRRLTYTATLLIRSRRADLTECSLRFNWTGETELTKNYRPYGEGFRILVTKDPNSRKVVFRFQFQPVRRYRRKRVGVQFDLNEPNRRYSRYVGYSGLSDYLALNAKLITDLTWDDSHPVLLENVRAYEFRSLWDRLDRLQAMRTWDRSGLGEPEDGSGIRWTISPVRPDRWYGLEWSLRDDDPSMYFQTPRVS